MTVYGDGRQSRCFGYVKDVVRILAALAELPEAVGEIVNVGNDDEITIADLAEQVRTHTQSSSEIVFVPYHLAYGQGFEDMQRRLPDLTKLCRLLGDRPNTDLGHILSAVTEHIRQDARAEVPAKSEASAGVPLA
jgi:UDP-glucose 4-epimerase